MQIFIVFTDSFRSNRRGIGGRVVTKRHEVHAVDMAIACEIARHNHRGSAVSMVWPKS